MVIVSIGADEVLFPPPVVDVGVEEAVTTGSAAAADATRSRTVNVSAERRFIDTFVRGTDILNRVQLYA